MTKPESQLSARVTYGVLLALIGLMLGGFYHLGARIDALADRLDARIDTVAARLEARIDANGARIDANGARIDANSARIDDLAVRVDGLSARIDDLVIEVARLGTQIERLVAAPEGERRRITGEAGSAAGDGERPGRGTGDPEAP